MLKRFIIVYAFMFKASLCAVHSEKEMIQNPFIGGDWSDPAFIRVGEDYYTVRSSVGWAPGLPIMHSRDLVHWEVIGHALTDFDVLPEWRIANRAGGVWAPDMIYNPNTEEYQIYATLGRGVALFASKEPEGPYEFVDKLEFGAIDPGVFVDRDNQIYGVAKSGELLLLSPDGRSIEKRLGKLKRTDGKSLGGEGPEFYRHGDYYYFTASHGGTLPYEGQTFTSYRSKSMLGPWEPDPENPIKIAPHTTKAAMQGPGHSELIETQNGEWYVTYHVHELDYPSLARQVALEPVVWTEDGWWRPKYGKLPPVEVEKPNLPESDIRLNQSDEFTTSKLSPQWFFHTIPDYSGTAWSLDERSGWLALKSHGERLEAMKQLQRFVLQRMTSKAFVITTKMEFIPTEGEFAGLILYADKENYIQFGVTEHEGERMLVQLVKAGAFHPTARQRVIPGVKKVMASTQFEGKEIYLRIKVLDPETAHFYYSQDNEKWKKFGREIFFGRSGAPDLGWQTRLWTGATFGLFIDRAESIESPSTAYFDWIRVN